MNFAHKITKVISVIFLIFAFSLIFALPTHAVQLPDGQELCIDGTVADSSSNVCDQVGGTASLGLPPNTELCVNGSILSRDNDADCQAAGIDREPNTTIVSRCAYRLAASATTNIDGLRADCIERTKLLLVQQQSSGGQQSGGGTAFTACNPSENAGTFLGINPWYFYLESGAESADGTCNVHIDNLNDIWKIVLAVLQALLRVAAYVATGFVIFAGFRYMTSNGNPEKTKQALGTIRMAAIGLILTIAATFLVSFIAGRF